MSAPVTSDSTVDSVPTNPYQPGITSSAVLDAPRREPAAATPGAAQLSSQSLAVPRSDREETKKRVVSALRQFPDFPIPGIDFIDILPIFQDPHTFESLLQVLELQIKDTLGVVPDVIVGLDARGFLFGPSLALRLNCSFVPVRKQGKMPGPCVTTSYDKEYGTDYFQMQSDAIQPGQRVLVVDDIIATGGSAAAAGSLVNQLGGKLVGYLFMIEITPLKGREKLGDHPILTLVEHT
ncbi:phosphoribosyltransferase-like protein [Xylariales sp. AK1849]|nr:phosphoribosyltransferase-like protein [Xylariales sp. AK1849]